MVTWAADNVVGFALATGCGTSGGVASLTGGGAPGTGVLSGSSSSRLCAPSTTPLMPLSWGCASSAGGALSTASASAAALAAAIDTETEVPVLALPLESLRFAGRVRGLRAREGRFGA